MVKATFGSSDSFTSVLFRYALPNLLTSVITFAALKYGNVILNIETLGFLDYSVPLSTSE